MKDSYLQHQLPTNSNTNLKLNAYQSHLVETHIGLVKILAQELLSNQGNHFVLTESDLVSAGNEGLIDAACHYDSERNASFKTYASTCIWNAMLAEIKRWFPFHTVVEEEIVQGKPTLVKKKESLFTRIDDASKYPVPSLCCDWEAEEAGLYETLDDAITHLEPSESQLIHMKYGFEGEEMKLHEMAKPLRITPQAVQKRIKKAENKLCTYFESANVLYCLSA